MNDPRDTWRDLNTKGGTVSAAEVRAKAQKLEAEIRRDTLIGFVFASAMTLAGLIALATLRQAEPIARIIIGLVVILIWFGAWRTTLRNKSRVVEANASTCLEFYRSELQRRRDYFARPPWFLLFNILLAVVLFLAVARQFNPTAGDLLPYPLALVGLLLVFLPLWKREARRFQRELDELERFREE